MEDKNIIDFKEWNVPTSWNDITLGKYEKIEAFFSEKENGFDMRECIHILCDKTIDEVNALPVEFVEDIMDYLKFLNEKPNVKEPTNSIIIDGEKYSINFMEKLKLGEYVSADNVLKNDKHNYAALLAILCRKDGEIYDSKFEAELYEDRVKLFEKQPITEILPIISFFLSLYVQLGIPSVLYTQVEEALNHIQQSIDNSQKIGGWKKLCMKWRITRLRKSLKSNKNISQTHSHSLLTSLKKVKWKRKKKNTKIC